MKVALSTDHRGVKDCDLLSNLIRRLGHDPVQVASCPAGSGSCDYPDMAWAVCRLVQSGEADRGILICGTGIGMSLAANKCKGIRAALCHDEVGATFSRSHNDANVLCMSADMLGDQMKMDIVRVWLSTEFEGGRHARRVRKIAAIERGDDPTTVTE